MAQASDVLAVAIESIPSGGGTLITKTITQNGTYNASADNADGYSQVTVNVASGVGVTVAETWVLNDELPIFDSINATYAFLVMRVCIII